MTEALAAWDAICAPTLARIRKLTPSRRRAILDRLREDFAGDLEQWRAYLHRIVAAPLLTGDGDRGWKADLDWVLEPRNLNRILEGRYDPPRRARPLTPKSGAAPLDPRYWDRPPAEVVLLPKPELGTPERDAWDEATYGRRAPPPAALRGGQAA